MNPNSTASRAASPHYAGATIALHWLSAVAVLIAFSVAWTRAAIDDSAPRALLMNIHQGAGLLVMALLMARIVTRTLTPAPVADPPLPPLLRMAAFGGHIALYGLLLAMPLLGWALTNAHGHDVHFPGLPAFPALVATDTDLADTLEEWHVGTAWVMGAMIVAHVGAALFHHFVRRDHVLTSMLPVAGAALPTERPRRLQPMQQNSRSF